VRVSINQPYFIPYAGYFRLFTACDVHVIYDDVDFSKGSWVNRNRLKRNDGILDWLHIPIKRPSLGTKIKDIEWLEGSDELWIKNSRRFKAFNIEPSSYLRFFVYYLQKANRRMDCEIQTPVEFIIRSIKTTLYDLGQEKNKPEIILSSSLNIPKEFKGQERVLWICDKFKAKQYVNAPGGKHLYDEDVFKKRGIDLKFFCDYPNKISILDRFMNEKPMNVMEEINDLSTFN
jgi:hypothetical protein